MRYCVQKGGRLLGGSPSVDNGARIQFVLTSSREWHARGITKGSSTQAARAALEDEQVIARRRHATILGVRGRTRVLIVIVRGSKVVSLAVAAPGLSDARIARYYVNSG
jgi:hypothetical protein